MHDPFQTLGIPPDADLADAEAAFRRELKRSHPDRHAGAPPAVVADAERRTRELTEAIRAVRAGWRPDSPRRVPDDAWHVRHGFATSEGTDWFGHPQGERTAAATCPLCGTELTDVVELELHFRAAHGHAGRRPGNRFVHWLRFLPAPSFSLFLVMVAWWVLVVALTPPAVERAGIWIGVIGFLLLRGTVYRAQRDRL